MKSSGQMPTESLLLGSEALKSVSEEYREEIKDLFPECLEPDFQPDSIRPVPQKGRLMHKLVERHQYNQKPLFSKELG